MSTLPPDDGLDGRERREAPWRDEPEDREDAWFLRPEDWLPRWMRRPWWWVLGGLAVALLLWAATRGHVFFLFLFIPLGFGLFRRRRP